MKKIIALLAALATLSCMLVGCGKDSDDSSSKSKKSSKTTTSANADNDEDDEEEEEETTRKKNSSKKATEADDDEDEDDEDDEEEDEDEEEEEETTKKKNSSKKDDEDDEFEEVDEDEDYMEVLEESIDAMNDGDYITLIENMFPEAFLDAMEQEGEVTLEELGESFSKMLSSSESKKEKVLPLTITDVYGRSATDDEIDSYNANFEKLISDSGFEDEFDIPEITDAYTLKVHYETASGKETVDEIVAYYLDGEGWKIDSGFFEYIEKSKKASAASVASSIQKASESTLVDLDCKGIDLKGTYIISSDESMNVDLPKDFPVDQMYKGMENYFSKLKKYDYFVVIKNGTTIFAACQEKNGGTIGTFPRNTVYRGGEPESSDENYDFDELYDLAYENLN